MIVYDIYSEYIPNYVQDIIQTSLFQRLKDVGMNCGMEYTQFEPFRNCKGVSRYNHSIGVALITYHFTHDKHQTVAALLHDISTPVFAHVIDFMYHDYTNQEATENLTEMMIKENKELHSIFHHYHIDVNKVVNYHDYPVADNETPKLSADRLEYTLSNAIYYGLMTKDNIKDIYNHLEVNQQCDEIIFNNQEYAIIFTQLMLKCSQIYVSDENRYCMEFLARLLKFAIDHHVLIYDDLYTTESQVIEKLIQNDLTQDYFHQYTQLNKILISRLPQDGYWKIVSKKRYINPLVSEKRILDICEDLQESVQLYLNNDFDYYVKAIREDK